MVQLSPLGILLGFVFVSAVGSLFVWMFHVPPLIPLPVVKVHRSIASVRKILVPIVEAIPSERAVELACRMGHDQGAELVLAHVIVVPYTLALNTPMPDREQTAREALELGGLIAQRYNCHSTKRIVRHRSAADGILQVARGEAVDAIVLGVGSKTRVPGEWGRTSIEVLRRANCEVIVDRVPIAVQTAVAPAPV